MGIKSGGELASFTKLVLILIASLLCLISILTCSVLIIMIRRAGSYIKEFDREIKKLNLTQILGNLYDE